MGVKIPSLPKIGTPDGDDELAIEDNSLSTTKSIKLTKLKEWFQSVAGWISATMLAADSVERDKIKNLAINAAKLDEVLLFNGTIARVITLSETYVNFKRLFVTYTWGNHVSTIIIDTSTPTVWFPVVRSGFIDGYYKIQIGAANIALSGTTMTGSAMGGTYVLQSTSSGVVTFSDAVAELKIIKVIGLRS